VPRPCTLPDLGKLEDLAAGNRLIRLCCFTCIGDFNNNPLKYLKTIDDASQRTPAGSPDPSGYGGPRCPPEHRAM